MKILGITINTSTKKIPELAGIGNSLCIATNSDKIQYVRSGRNENAGKPQTDIFKIDAQGNVLNEIIWDFDKITNLQIIPIPEKKVTVKNGNFKTITKEKNENEQINTYYQRNIYVSRSNTELNNITHKLFEDVVGRSYYGFIQLEYATNIKIDKAELFSYLANGYSSYDLIIEYCTNVTVKDVTSNEILDTNRWGITGSNYTKDIVYENCILNRIDAHQGVHNLTLNNCKIGIYGITIAGSGNLIITKTENYGQEAFITLRRDFRQQLEWKYNNNRLHL